MRPRPSHGRCSAINANTKRPCEKPAKRDLVFVIDTQGHDADVRLCNMHAVLADRPQGIDAVFSPNGPVRRIRHNEPPEA